MVFFVIEEDHFYMRQKYHIVYMLIAILSVGCSLEETKLSEMEEYEGPAFESTGVEVLMSDSTVLKIKLTGDRQIQYQNGDLEFPEGIKLIFYSKLGIPITEITAQEGYKAADENIYRARGDVLVKDLVEKKSLNSEELFWDPQEQTIYTDKFVTIETLEELIFAEGLTAPQDFSTFELINPKDSEFIIKENELVPKDTTMDQGN
jgi:LPS export ABC transporter protein LptC